MTPRSPIEGDRIGTIFLRVRRHLRHDEAGREQGAVSPGQPAACRHEGGCAARAAAVRRRRPLLAAHRRRDRTRASPPALHPRAAIRVVGRHDGVVDLEVTASDVWTLSPGLAFGRKGGANHSELRVRRLQRVRHRQAAVDRRAQRRRSHVEGVPVRRSECFRFALDHQGKLLEQRRWRRAALEVERPFYSFDTRWTAGINARLRRRRAAPLLARPSRRRVPARMPARPTCTSARRAAGTTAGCAASPPACASTMRSSPTRPASHRPSRPARRPDVRRIRTPAWSSSRTTSRPTRTSTRSSAPKTSSSAAASWSSSATRTPTFGGDRSAALLRAEASRGWRLHPHHSLFFGAGLSGRFEGGATRNAIYSAGARYYWRTSPNTLFHASLQRRLRPRARSRQRDHARRRQRPARLSTALPVGRRRARCSRLEQRFFTNWYPFQLVQRRRRGVRRHGPQPGAASPLGTPVAGHCCATSASACASATAVPRSATCCTSTSRFRSTATPRSRTSSS